MITEYNDRNENEVVKLVTDETCFSPDEVLNTIKGENAARAVFVDDNTNKIVGYAGARFWNSEKNIELVIFVANEFRRKHIGTKLYNYIIEKIHPLELVDDITDGKINGCDEFFESVGHNYWYEELIMVYEGGAVEKPDINMIKYDDKYFETYANEFLKAFVPLRTANDFKPYAPFEVNEKIRDALKKTDDIWLLLDGKNIVGAIKNQADGMIENVFVAKEYRHKGYAQKIVRFAIWLSQKEKRERIFLSAITWNKPAVAMYKNLGFKIERSMKYYRLVNAK